MDYRRQFFKESNQIGSIDIGFSDNLFRKILSRALTLLLFCAASVVQGQSKNPTIKDIWSKDFDTPIQDVNLKVGEDGTLKAVAVQTYDEGNKATGFYAFDSNGKLIHEEKPSKIVRTHLLLYGKRIVYSEKWSLKKINAPKRKSKTATVATADRSFHIEDHQGKSLGNGWSFKDDLESAELFFSPDGSICLLRGSAEEGTGGTYKIYSSKGDLLANGDDKQATVTNVFFSNGGQGVGFCYGKKLLVFDRSGQKLFDYPVDQWVEQCEFSNDGTKIIILSRTNLTILDKNGAAVSKIPIPDSMHGWHFFQLENGEIGLNDITRVWILNSGNKFELLKQFGEIADFSKRVTGISDLCVFDNHIVVSVWNKVGESSIVLLDSNGNVLASKNLPRYGSIKVSGQFFSLSTKEHLGIFKVE